MTIKDTVSDVGTTFVLLLLLPVLITYGAYSWFEGREDRQKLKNMRLNHESDTRALVACLHSSRAYKECYHLRPKPLPQ